MAAFSLSYPNGFDDEVLEVMPRPAPSAYNAIGSGCPSSWVLELLADRIEHRFVALVEGTVYENMIAWISHAMVTDPRLAGHE